MKSRFGNVWLAPGSVERVAGLSLNGTQLNDEAQFYRAASTTLYARGGRAHAIGFGATRGFNSVLEAERFVHEHFSTLPEQADLVFFIGAGDEQIVTYPDAVIDAVGVSYIGTSVRLQYSLRASAPLFDEPPPTVTEPDADMIKRGTTAIANGATSVAVTFSVPFAGTPVVTVSMQSPNGGDAIWAWVRDGTVSTTGFTADLSGAVPSGDYKLAWIASA